MVLSHELSVYAIRFNFQAFFFFLTFKLLTINTTLMGEPADSPRFYPVLRDSHDSSIGPFMEWDELWSNLTNLSSSYFPITR